MLVAVDIGNTNIVLGFLDGDTIAGTYRITTKANHTSDEYGLFLTEFLRMSGFQPSDVDDVIICSVVPKVMHSFRSSIVKFLDIDPMVVGPGIKTGMNVRVDDPKSLGADILADCAGAYYEYGGPVLVADFGTATTFTHVSDKGVVDSGVITTGIRQEDMQAILGGTGVLMAAALVLDLLMGMAERYLNSRDSQRPRGCRMAARGAAVLSCAAALALCVYAFLPKSTAGLLLYEGQFSEVQLVNSMIKQLVEDRHGIPVTIQDEMTAVNNFNALTAANHSCDLMYTWDGTLLTTIMGLDTTDIPEGQTLYDFVNEKMNEEYDLQLLGKIGVNNTYVIGVTQEVVDTYHPETISDLVPIAGELRFCAEQDFFTDAGNMKFGPMVETYGLNFQVANPVDIMMKYTLIEQGAYDVMVVYATDGLNKRANLTLLDDDQHFFPDYYGTILARSDVFERFAEDAPGLKETIQLLNEQFTDELMSELTYRVDVAGEEVETVAHDFLVQSGLLDA